VTTGDGLAGRGGREIQSFVRSRRRLHSRRRTSDRLVNAYMGLIAVFYLGLVVSGFVDSDFVPESGHFLDTIAWLPLLLLAAVWAVLRFATWQGPVLFSPPELQWVLSAPVSRRALVLMRLRRALVIAGVAGVIGGVIAAVAADVMIGEGLVAVFGAATLGFGALALTATALSWHVERSPRWRNVIGRFGPLALVLAALLGVGAASGYDTALWWSGPWGWATGPIVAVAGWSVSGWVVQALLLGIATIAAVAAARLTAEDYSEEELWRRAETRSAASAALFFGDVRTLSTVARRERVRDSSRKRSFRMPRFPSPWLTIAGRDVLTMLRNPRLITTAAVFMAAAFAAAVAAIDRPILAIGAFVGLYLAGSRLLEPIRLEADQPDAHRILPWPWGTVLVLHCIVPTVVLSVLGWVGLTVVGVSGLVSSTDIWPLGLVTPFVAATIVTAAAIAAQRQPFPLEMSISGAESGSLVLLAWLVSGPILAAVAVNVAFFTMRDSLDQGIIAATRSALIVLIIATVGFGGWLWTRKPPD
jgi:Family of unknown function (DUF6297)